MASILNETTSAGKATPIQAPIKKRTISKNDRPSKRSRPTHIMSLDRDIDSLNSQHNALAHLESDKAILLNVLRDVGKVHKTYADHSSGTPQDPDKLYMLVRVTLQEFEAFSERNRLEVMIDALRSLKNQFELEDKPQAVGAGSSVVKIETQENNPTSLQDGANKQDTHGHKRVSRADQSTAVQQGTSSVFSQGLAGRLPPNSHEAEIQQKTGSPAAPSLPNSTDITTLPKANKDVDKSGGQSIKTLIDADVTNSKYLSPRERSEEQVKAGASTNDLVVKTAASTTADKAGPHRFDVQKIAESSNHLNPFDSPELSAALNPDQDASKDNKPKATTKSNVKPAKEPAAGQEKKKADTANKNKPKPATNTKTSTQNKTTSAMKPKITSKPKAVLKNKPAK